MAARCSQYYAVGIENEGFRPDRRYIFFLHEIIIHDFLLLSANV